MNPYTARTIAARNAAPTSYFLRDKETDGGHHNTLWTLTIGVIVFALWFWLYVVPRVESKVEAASRRLRICSQIRNMQSRRG